MHHNITVVLPLRKRLQTEQETQKKLNYLFVFLRISLLKQVILIL